jgi:hypothetical protein
MMRNAALIVCVTALLAACATAPEGVTARSQLPGKWDWEKSEPRCGDAAGTFSFSPDGRQVRVNVPAAKDLGTGTSGRDVVYEVLAEEGKTMRLRAVGETRKTDAGVPVEWNLLMLNADTFCWRRTDWKAGACTALLKRCAT